MRTLIVAATDTPDQMDHLVATGVFPRVDYLELARKLNTRVLDNHAVQANKLGKWLENAVRMDVHLARHATRIAIEGGYQQVFSLSEGVGIPLAQMLPKKIAHAMIVHHPMSRLRLQLMRHLRIHYNFRHIFAISTAEAEGLKRILALRGNSEVFKAMVTPVDTHFFQPMPTPLEAQTHIQSLGLSHRDFPTLLRAMRRLPDILCTLRIGSAWVARKSGIEGEALPENISLAPYLTPNELRKSYATSRFIVVPILNDTQWSAGCTTVQQAQAMGRAVIASDRPGLASYLRDGETGILVRTGDDQDLGDAIEYLWRNPERAEEMGAAGRELMASSQSLDMWLERVCVLLGSASTLNFNGVVPE